MQLPQKYTPILAKIATMALGDTIEFVEDELDKIPATRAATAATFRKWAEANQAQLRIEGTFRGSMLRVTRVEVGTPRVIGPTPVKNPVLEKWVQDVLALDPGATLNILHADLATHGLNLASVQTKLRKEAKRAGAKVRIGDRIDDQDRPVLRVARYTAGKKPWRETQPPKPAGPPRNSWRQWHQLLINLAVGEQRFFTAADAQAMGQTLVRCRSHMYGWCWRNDVRVRIVEVDSPQGPGLEMTGVATWEETKEISPYQRWFDRMDALAPGAGFIATPHDIPDIKASWQRFCAVLQQHHRDHPPGWRITVSADDVHVQRAHGEGWLPSKYDPWFMRLRDMQPGETLGVPESEATRLGVKFTMFRLALTRWATRQGLPLQFSVFTGVQRHETEDRKRYFTQQGWVNISYPIAGLPHG